MSWAHRPPRRTRRPEDIEVRDLPPRRGLDGVVQGEIQSVVQGVALWRTSDFKRDRYKEFRPLRSAAI